MSETLVDEEEPKAEDKKEEPEPLPVDDDLGLDNLLSETSVDEEEPKAEDKKEEPEPLPVDLMTI